MKETEHDQWVQREGGGYTFLNLAAEKQALEKGWQQGEK